MADHYPGKLENGNWPEFGDESCRAAFEFIRQGYRASTYF
jgi:hypothetical protein